MGAIAVDTLLLLNKAEYVTAARQSSVCGDLIMTGHIIIIDDLRCLLWQKMLHARALSRASVVQPFSLSHWAATWLYGGHCKCMPCQVELEFHTKCRAIQGLTIHT
jgi:hypothetical protein